MSGTPKPTTGALERIRVAGDKELLAFLDEVSAETTDRLIGFLPPVHGFRESSKPGIQLRKKALSKKFSGNRVAMAPNRAQADLALYAFWCEWGCEHLGDPIAIRALLDAIEAGVKHEKSDPALGVAPVEKVEELFASLNAMSLQNKCSREAIARFFLFSPFDESPEIHRLIQGAKPATDVERDRAISGLPQRLSKDEEEIKVLEERLHSLVTRLDSSTAEMQALRKDIHAARSEQETQVGRSTKNRESIEKLSQDIKALEELAGVQQAALARHVEENSEKLQRFAHDFRDEMRSHAQQGESAEIEELLLGLENRVNAIEDVQRQTPVVSDDADYHQPRNETATAQAAIRLRPLSSKTEFKDCETIVEMAEILSLNLESIGMKKSAAEILAGEICAAAFVGQIVFLEGAMASDTARICAFTLGGGLGSRLPLPLGLVDQDPVYEALAAALPKGKDFVPAVAIEGINRVALDIVSDVLKDIVRGETLLGSGTSAPVFLFGSIASGPAGLPIDPHYLTFGPVFDLDQIDWRLRPMRKPIAVTGRISVVAYNFIRTELDAANVDSDELLRLLRRFQTRRNPQIESTAVSALAAISSMSAGRTLPSPLQSLAFGWLVPLWIISRVSRNDVDSEIDGGKCDATTPDPRLVNLLAGDVFTDERHTI